MGTSIAMIDLHYGHLAVDSYQHAVSLLDALALERAVDAGWTPAHRRKVAQRHGFQASSKAPLGGRWSGLKGPLVSFSKPPGNTSA